MRHGDSSRRPFELISFVRCGGLDSFDKYLQAVFRFVRVTPFTPKAPSVCTLASHSLPFYIFLHVSCIPFLAYFSKVFRLLQEECRRFEIRERWVN